MAVVACDPVAYDLVASCSNITGGVWLQGHGLTRTKPVVGCAANKVKGTQDVRVRLGRSRCNSSS